MNVTVNPAKVAADPRQTVFENKYVSGIERNSNRNKVYDYLVKNNPGIDTDKDGVITYKEIAAIQGLLINPLNNVGDTGLLWAVENNQTELAELLLASGVNINATNYEGDAALHVVVKKADAKMVGFLLSKGADINVKNSEGWTALTGAAFRGGETDIDMMKLLIANGADVNATDREKRTPLMWATCLNKTEPAKLLLAAGAKVDLQDKRGWTALMGAAANMEIEAVALLLKNNADVTKHAQNGKTVLMQAAEQEDPKMVNLLLLKGHAKEVFAKDSNFWTAYMHAASKGNTDTALALLKAGSYPDARSNENKTAVELALNNWHIDTALRLFVAGLIK